MGIDLNFLSKNQQLDKSYELSAIIGRDMLFYALLDYGHQLVKSNFVEFYSYGMESAHVILGEIFEKEEIQLDKLRKVKIGILNSECTVLPRSHYDANLKRNYLEHLVDMDDQGSLVYSDFSNKHVFVYQADVNLVESIKYIFDEPQIYHVEKALVDSELTVHNSGIYIHFFDTEIQIQHIEQQELKMSTSYHIPSPLAALYYLMQYIQSHQLDPASTKVWISGQIEENSELVDLFKKYLRHIEMVDCPIHFENYSDFPAHYFYPLFCVSQCA